MKVMYPLFWNLSPAAQAALMQYQWGRYKTRLDAPLKPKEGGTEYPAVVEEDLEEIDRLMRQAPSTSRGKDG